MPPKAVRVFVRTKPVPVFPADVFELAADGRGISVHLKRGASGNQPEKYGFSFDGVLHEATQQAVYDAAASDVVIGALDGFNGTVMCYGQTGAGKTFTTTGATESFEHRGLIPRAIAHLFREVRSRTETATSVRVSYVEVYNEHIYDLLNNSGSGADAEESLRVAEDASGAAVIRGARVEPCASEEEALRWLFEGETNRTIAEHSMNVRSSRSHCVFTLHVEMRSLVESVERVVTSKLHFVDLAGSERLAKTHSQGETMREAMYINKSLTFLEQVILALADKAAKHVPYRQSRLTNILRDSLGGNCRTTLIANIRSEPQHAEETVATLRFAARMALMNNTAVANVQYDPVQLLHKAEREIRELKSELAMHDQIAGRSHVQYDAFTEEQQAQQRARIRAYIRGEIPELDFATLRQMREIIVQFRNVAREIEREAADRIKTEVAAATTAAAAAAATATSSSQQAAASSAMPSLQSARKLVSTPSRKARALEAAGADLAPDRPPSSQQSTQLPPLDQKGRTSTPKSIGAARSKSEASQQPSAEDSAAPPAAGEKESEKRGGGGKRGKDKKKGPQQSSSTAADKPQRGGGGGRKRHGKQAPTATTAEPAEPEESGTAEEQSLLADQASSQQQLAGDGNDASGALASAADGSSFVAAPEPPKPADKAAAFEVFKAYRGKEIHTTLVDNKQQLRLRRKALHEAADTVNRCKREIDELRTLMQRKREERMNAPDFDAEGEEVIDEEEFEAMQRLKACKREYREGFEQVTRLRADVEYLAGSIDQCRQRLLAEFEDWFGEPTSAVAAAADSTIMPAVQQAQQGETADFEEAFDRAQQERLEEQRRQDPEAFAYFSAMQKTKTAASKRK